MVSKKAPTQVGHQILLSCYWSVSVSPRRSAASQRLSWIFPLHSKLPRLLGVAHETQLRCVNVVARETQSAPGTVFLLEHSFLSAETEKQETAQDSPVSILQIHPASISLNNSEYACGIIIAAL